jgi:uncharacterized protein (DUF302 family)
LYPPYLHVFVWWENAVNTDAAVDGLRMLPTQRSVADVLSRVESLARARGLTIFAQIDFSGDAQRSGLALRPAGLVVLGNAAANPSDSGS